VTFFRSILYERSWPDPWLSLATVAVSSVFFVAGWWLFIRKSSEFPYFV
jgi:ABC-type polysaccharide/polyol phosphate export permease